MYEIEIPAEELCDCYVTEPWEDTLLGFKPIWQRVYIKAEKGHTKAHIKYDTYRRANDGYYEKQFDGYAYFYRSTKSDTVTIPKNLIPVPREIAERVRDEKGYIYYPAN